MSNFPFPSINKTNEYLSAMSDGLLKEMYSKFDFLIAEIDFNDPNNNIQDIIQPLSKFKFMTYGVLTFPEINPKQRNTQNDELNKYNISFCVEKHFIVIENIEYNLISGIIEELDKSSKLINYSNTSIFSMKSNNASYDARDEVKSFKEHFFRNKKIDNLFIKNTIDVLSGYLIRRNYFPSNYFEDPSFFTFDQTDGNPFEKAFKNNLSAIIDKKVTDKKSIDNFLISLINYLIENKNIDQLDQFNIFDFHINDFIYLRDYRSDHVLYRFALHIKSLHIFAIKMIINNLLSKDEIDSEIWHEMDFVLNFPHRSFVRFYGFLYDNKQEVGFVYEFMSNGTLDEYKEKYPNDEFMFHLAMRRVASGIQHLHSNERIHRDLKPMNILVDHDNIPYISDFETIRYIDESEEVQENLTKDIGSQSYASPEQQSENGVVSFPTDIYSFGKIIEFLFTDEKNKYNNYLISPLVKLSTKEKQSERPQIKEIIESINMDFITCDILKNISYKNTNEIVAYFYISISQNNSISSLMNHLFDYLKMNKIKLLDSFDLLIIGELSISSKQDRLKAIVYFELSAKQNNSFALNNLGDLYYYGYGVKQDYLKAKEYYELSSKQNNSYALYNLGNLYKNGYGIKQDYLKAKEYYELSSKQNNSYALNNLGNLYYFGYGVKQDYLKAKEYYELSSKQNNSSAINNLGNLYYFGYGVKQDYLKAKEYYELSSKQNNSYALNNLGNLYKNGHGVKQDYLKAKEYYELSSKQNNSDALIYLGNLYENGHGVKQDYLKAKEYYELSSKQNNSFALNNLGNLYKNGHGVKQDYLKAKEYYELSSKQNNSFALNNLGNLYYYGYGVKQDYLKAKEYYELSSKQNNSFALNNLGNLYKNGHGVKQDYLKAKEYYELSSKQNNSDALNNLGNLYANGHGVKQDYLKAKEYYELSSKQNNSDALIYLGNLYENGHGVKQDYLKAKEYYELSSKQNNSFALFKLGQIYSNEKKFINLSKAIKCFKKCYEIFFQEIETISPDQSSTLSICYNYYRYRSVNDLGLVYLTCFQDIEKAVDYIKESAFGEYPFGQNNYGLLNQFYLNEFQKAEHFYKRSSEHDFCLAEFNLGRMREQQDGREDESIRYYIIASEHEKK